MTLNMTVCPECEETFETEDAVEIEDGIIQGLKQVCPQCNYKVEVGIINYSNGVFEVDAPALEDDMCDPKYGRCNNSAKIRKHKLTEKVRGLCEDHMGEHHLTAINAYSEP